MAKLSLAFVSPVSGLPAKWQGVYANSITVNGKKHEFKDEKGEVSTQWGAVQTVDLIPDSELESPATDDVYQTRLATLAASIGWAAIAQQAQASIDLQCSKKFRDSLADKIGGGSEHLNATQAFVFAGQIQPYFGELCQALATRADTKPILLRAFAEHKDKIAATSAGDPNVNHGKDAFDATKK